MSYMTQCAHCHAFLFSYSPTDLIALQADHVCLHGPAACERVEPPKAWRYLLSEQDADFLARMGIDPS